MASRIFTPGLLDGHVALVTGGGTGLGRATAAELLACGASVVICGRREEVLEEAAAALGERCGFVAGDVREQADAERIVDACLERHGRLDTLVNNAGYGVIGGVEQVRIETARRSFETNVWGTMALVQEALPPMRRQSGGHVLVVSSCFVAGLPVIGMGYYLAAKAALETILFSLAAEAAPHGIKVTSFQPGPVMTDLERVWPDREPPGGDPRPSLSDELYGWVANAGPPPQQPAEVADALAALVAADDPPLAAPSGDASQAYAAAALRDPSRRGELAALLDQLDPAAR